MAKHRIKCTECDWHTRPYYSELDCIKEKERAHMAGLVRYPDANAHDAAFGDYCPECGGKCVTEYKWFD